jgi:hypothetical protein
MRSHPKSFAVETILDLERGIPDTHDNAPAQINLQPSAPRISLSFRNRGDRERPEKQDLDSRTLELNSEGLASWAEILLNAAVGCQICILSDARQDHARLRTASCGPPPGESGNLGRNYGGAVVPPRVSGKSGSLGRNY